MEAVSNTSPLIFLTKVPGLLPILERQFARVWVPQAVYGEAVTAALASTKPQVRENGQQIRRLLEKPPFKVEENVEPLEGLPQRLGPGERAVLALALSRKIQTVIIDERLATSTARQLGLQPLPISALPLIGLRKAWLEPEAAKALLEELAVNQYRLSAKAYLRLLNAVEGNRKKE